MTEEELSRIEARHNARVKELRDHHIPLTAGDEIISSLLRAIRERQAEVRRLRAAVVEVPVLGKVE